MKKKTPLIVTICLMIAFAIAAVLCFVIPKFTPKPEAPVEVSQTIKLENKAVDYLRADYLVGKIRNRSDKTIQFKDTGDLKVYFKGSDDVAQNWSETAHSGIAYIVLEPGEELDLSVHNYYFLSSSDVTVSKVTIDIDGTTYYLVGSEGGGIASTLGLVFVILAATMLIVTIALAMQNKTGAVRAEALTAVCNRLGDNSVVISGSVTDKTESKKATAKTAGWILGGIIGAIFTGVGVYRVYSGTAQKQFIINKNSLYVINDGDVNVDNLSKITPESYAVDCITVKKNTVIMKTADKKQTVKFYTNKKSPLSAEQLAEYLNNIFINKAAIEAEETAPTVAAATPDDPFTDLQPDVAATDATAEQVVEKEVTVEETPQSENADDE